MTDDTHWLAEVEAEDAAHARANAEWLADELHLIERAAELYPDSAYLQSQWLRAVMVVRATARGWLLNAPIVRLRDGGPIRGGR